MIWYHNALLFFYASPDLRCAVWPGAGTLTDAADGTPSL